MGLLFFDRWACDCFKNLLPQRRASISQPARGYEVLDIVIPGNGALGPELLACSSSNTPGNLRKSRLPTTAFFQNVCTAGEGEWIIQYCLTTTASVCAQFRQPWKKSLLALADVQRFLGASRKGLDFLGSRDCHGSCLHGYRGKRMFRRSSSVAKDKEKGLATNFFVPSLDRCLQGRTPLTSLTRIVFPVRTLILGCFQKG